MMRSSGRTIWLVVIATSVGGGWLERVAGTVRRDGGLDHDRALRQVVSPLVAALRVGALGERLERGRRQPQLAPPPVMGWGWQGQRNLHSRSTSRHQAWRRCRQ